MHRVLLRVRFPDSGELSLAVKHNLADGIRLDLSRFLAFDFSDSFRICLRLAHGPPQQHSLLFANPDDDEFDKVFQLFFVGFFRVHGVGVPEQIANRVGVADAFPLEYV
jgi:preprotein translocase subunit Sss1